MTHSYSFEDIARYASGEMDAGEKAIFEEVLQQNTDLQQKLALHNEIQATLQQQFTTDTKQEALQKTLQQLNKEYFGAQRKSSPIISLKKIRLAVTATAAAVIALLIWQPWQKDIYTRYADTEMIVNTERGEQADSLLNKATLAFNNKQFEEAAPLLQKVVALQPDNSLALFYYGVSLTHTDKLTTARRVLTQVYNGTSAYKHEAAFYIALSYIKEKNKENATEWLQKVPEDAAIYNKARQLLNDL